MKKKSRGTMCGLSKSKAIGKPMCWSRTVTGVEALKGGKA